MNKSYLDPCIITKDCITYTNRQRIRNYREKLDFWMENALPEAEVITVKAETPAKQIANNISRILRIGTRK